jgi:hypothetical protein
VASLPSVHEATDIILLTHNRLEHLVATVEALEARTRAPYRLTVVDNASGPEVRNWLAANRHRFHQLLLRSENEFLPALNHGIAATTSDPYIVTDPDLVVPDLQPCWLEQMLGMLDRHPDFGLLGIGLDQSNLPAVQAPEDVRADEIVDGEIVARPVGSVYQMIRRGALRSPYLTDWATCQSVARAGYRYGWTLDVRAYHLGWDDYRLYPGHLASKLVHGEYREVDLIERAPTLSELALAGPILAETRGLGIPDAAVLELTWAEPAVAASVPAAVAVPSPPPGRLPLGDGAAGAVVLVDPPAEGLDALVAEAWRIGAGAVIAVADLATLGGRLPADLSPPGWDVREAPGPGDVPLALARMAADDPAVAAQLGVRTLDDRERWLTLFGAAAFGAGRRRLLVWRPQAARPIPDAVRDGTRLAVWRPVAVAPRPPRRAFQERVRAGLARRARVLAEVVRLRVNRVRPGSSRLP